MSEHSYKDTLNLPHTDFPMKANMAQRGRSFIEQWQGLYEQFDRNGEPFMLLDGPPYANGPIHVGHALNKILKDTVLKSKRLSGHFAPFVPTWDCHGLPIELQVEKKKGKVGQKIDAPTFRQACREYAGRQVEQQRNDFIELGILADWSKPSLSMDKDFEANTVRALSAIYDQGHVTQGFKPVHWCLDCRSSLAEAEVEYKDKISESIDVAFVAVDPKSFAACFGVDEKIDSLDVLIWTTTPWTLPANMAVSVGPEIDYALVKANKDGRDKHVVLSAELCDDVMARCGIENYEVLANCQGQALEKQMLQHPWTSRQVPVLLGDHVSTEAGTGLVHTAPAHGVDDYQVCKHYGIESVNPVDGNGCFVEGTEGLAGLHVKAANPRVIEILTEKQRLWHHSQIEHSYPHCWRHKSPLIFRATPQWFISMQAEDLQGKAMQAIDEVKWIPALGRKRIGAMLDNRPDWCISRQRAWGVPLPIFVDKNTQAPHPKTAEIMRAVADRIERDGLEAWFSASVSDFLPADEVEQYVPVRDTLDVWFDSGASCACLLGVHPDLSFPANLYLEGSDQHRGWFQTSLLASLARDGRKPYEEVLTHGYVLDAKGHKMSKSLGNVVSPQSIVKTHGADILRLWVASNDYSTDMAISDESLKRTADVYRRLRNTARFLLSNLAGFDPKTDRLEHDQWLALDQWVVARAKALQAEIIEAYDAYQFHQVVQKVHQFCSVDLGSFYLDIIKDRQYTCHRTSRARRSAQSAMFALVEALACWVAPILSFTAEDIWQHIPGVQREKSVFLARWSNALSDLPARNPLTMAQWNTLLEIRDQANKVLEPKRREGLFGSLLEIELTLYVDDATCAMLKAMAPELHFIFITSEAKLAPLSQAPADAMATERDDLKMTLVKSQAPKCERCWHRREDVGANPDYPGICTRCVENIVSAGEERCYA